MSHFLKQPTCSSKEISQCVAIAVAHSKSANRKLAFPIGRALFEIDARPFTSNYNSNVRTRRYFTLQHVTPPRPEPHVSANMTHHIPLHTGFYRRGGLVSRQDSSHPCELTFASSTLTEHTYALTSTHSTRGQQSSGTYNGDLG